MKRISKTPHQILAEDQDPLLKPGYLDLGIPRTLPRRVQVIVARKVKITHWALALLSELGEKIQSATLAFSGASTHSRDEGVDEVWLLRKRSKVPTALKEQRS